MENPFKKSPAKKIEGLEEQIKAERMKLMSNDEKLKKSVDEMGGIKGINSRLEVVDYKGKQSGEHLKYGAIFATGGTIAALCMILGDFNPETVQRLGVEQTENFKQFYALCGLGFTVAGTALATSGAVGKVRNWFEKRKLENLKEDALEQGVAA